MPLLLVISVALAVEPVVEPLVEAAVEAPADTVERPQNALMVNPVGPALALVVNALDLGESFLRVWALDFNLRGHHQFNDRLGLTAQVDLTSGEFLVQATHLGFRVGPRIALGKRGLADWAFSPFLLVGFTDVRAGEYRLASWGDLGMGFEVGRTFVWKEFAIELGTGFYSTVPVGYSAHSPSFEGTEAPQALPNVMPLLNASVGHAF